MKHINAKLNANVENSYSVRNNVERLERSITWDHNQATEAYFGECMVACAVEMGTGGDFSTLDSMFELMTSELVVKKDITELEMNYLGEVWSAADSKKGIKNGRYGTKLHTSAAVSVLTRWVPYEQLDAESQAEAVVKARRKAAKDDTPYKAPKGLSKGYDTKEDVLEYLHHGLAKDTMAFAAKAHIMRQMGEIVDEALKDQVVDPEFITSKAIQRDGMKRLKWGTVMGAVFWLGLAYKLHHTKEVRDDGTEWSFSSYVEWRSGKLHKELRRCRDEQWEVGHYLIEDQQAVEELEHRMCQYELLAPYAESLFDWIDLWNVVEEWAYEESSEYAKIILHKTPQDRTTEEKERELESILGNVARYEATYLKGKNKVEKKEANALYEELKAKADALREQRKALA